MKNKKGFTLVELIAIIIIMGIIIGIIAPTAIKLVEKSKANSFREGLRSIIRSAEVYMEENDLKTLPEEGIYLQDNDLDIDYADGYNGIIKYVDGEIVVQNIGNGTYCGNGNKDTLTVTNYGEDCTAIKPATQCFIMGKTDTAGDTITGYDYDNEDCDPTNLVIPAAVNEVPVKYIADGAFIRQYDYILYYNEMYGEYDIKENWDALGLEYSYALPVSMNSSSLVKGCYNPNDDDWYNVNFDYKIIAGDDYEYCGAYSNSGDIWDNEAESTTISSVDFSNAINLVSIGDAAFYGNIINELKLGNLSNLVNIGTSTFSSNNINGTLDLTVLSNLNKISSDSFYGNNIDFVELPSNLESIGYYSFGDNNLSDITIPASVTFIKDWAFDDNYWNTVTIESNTENTKYRFNYNWVRIGWPSSLMIEQPESDPVNYDLTTSVNTFPYIYGYYIVNVQTTGNYKLEVWGAQGGISGHNYGDINRGGYSVGNITLTAGTVLYVYVGGRGQDGIEDYFMTPLGGYNGGGSGGEGESDNAGGGGASDIRLNNNMLTSRIIVAGGGGGNGCESVGGYGGGLIGGTGTVDEDYGPSGGGGTQTEGGIGQVAGSLGLGANGLSGYDWGNGGGGGGYYGGASGTTILDEGGSAGGGGSGYIGGVTSAQTIAGNASMPTYNGSSTMIGNFGNGYAKITYIG